jgi:hypothetical protein
MASMEVRRPVIVEVHRDHDPEEAADRRHAPDAAVPAGRSRRRTKRSRSTSRAQRVWVTGGSPASPKQRVSQRPRSKDALRADLGERPTDRLRRALPTQITPVARRSSTVSLNVSRWEPVSDTPPAARIPMNAGNSDSAMPERRAGPPALHMLRSGGPARSLNGPGRIMKNLGRPAGGHAG